MADELKDPNRSAHEIIEVLEDGGAIRNDGVRLTAANKNPWYVLATIYGEQEEGVDIGSYDRQLAAKNRRAWNGWSCRGLNDGERKKLAEKLDLPEIELRPLSDEELEGINQKFALRMHRVDAEEVQISSIEDTYDFSQVYHSKPVVFDRFAFVGGALFNKAAFQSLAAFEHSVFISATIFNSAMFSGYASFSRVNFSSVSGFGSVVFLGIADFIHVRFNSMAVFDDVIFHSRMIFDNANFNGSIQFNHSKFITSIPQFHGASLSDGPVFSTRENDQLFWPPIKGTIKTNEYHKPVPVMPTTSQKRAYNRLRLLMNKSLQTDEEQYFQRQEMRCKSVMAKWYDKPFYWLYALLSDYGNSVVRPLVGIIAVICFGALFMLWWQGAFTFLPKEAAGFDWTLGLLGEDDPWAKPRQAAGWSISNTLPFLGFGKLYYGGEFAVKLAWPLKVAGGVNPALRVAFVISQKWAAPDPSPRAGAFAALLIK